MTKQWLAFFQQDTNKQLSDSHFPPLSDSLIIMLDANGWLVSYHGQLSNELATPSVTPRMSLADILFTPAPILNMPASTWCAGSVDLCFKSKHNQPIYTRGWLQKTDTGWQLILTDISDIVIKANGGEQKLQLFRYLHTKTALLATSTQLAADINLLLEKLALRLHIDSMAIALPHPNKHWCLYQHYSQPNASIQWWNGYYLADKLQHVTDDGPVSFRFNESHCGSQHILAIPFQQHNGITAWLVCANSNAPPAASDMSALDWSHLCNLLLGPLQLALDRQQQQQALRRHQALQQLNNVGWCEYHPRQGIFYLAPNLLSILGLPLEQTVSLDQWLALISGADREEFAYRLTHASAERTDMTQNIRLLLEGQPRWYQCRLQATSINNQHYLMGTLLDIQDLEQQKQSAEAANNRITSLIASAPAIIYVLNYEQEILTPAFFSASSQAVLGWTPSQLQDMSISTLLHPDDQDVYFNRTRHLLIEGVTSSRYRLRDSRNHYHWLLDEARLLRDAMGQPQEVVGLYIDITDTHIANEKLRHSEERYRALVEDSPAIICRYQPDLTLTYGNALLNRYLGFDTLPLQTINLADWLSAEQVDAFQLRLTSLTPQSPIAEAEFCLHLPHRLPLWLVWSERGIFDSEGTLCEVQAVGRDNTEVHETKLQLYQNTKMAILGEISTTLAHEMAQPLNVISIALANLLKRIESGAYSSEYIKQKLTRIEEQVARSTRIINHMRVFGRRSALNKTVFDPQQAIEGALSLTRAALEKNGVEIILRLTPVPAVSGHLDQLEQVFINLLINAKDAMSTNKAPGYKPSLTIRAYQQDNHIILQVEDNGGGIAEQHIRTVFEPFFTTKPAGVGTGLGLSVSYGIIEQMQGQLTVANTGQGALFAIRLPATSTATPGENASA